MTAAATIPAEWTADPKYLEFLGRDADGTEYWRVRWEVVTYRNGSTIWLCSVTAWPTFCRIHDVITA